jgi:hypothetical protein
MVEAGSPFVQECAIFHKSLKCIEMICRIMFDAIA